MHGLEKEIEAWRARMLGGDAISRDTVRELESHLRDAMDGYVSEGLSPQAALERATQDLGEFEALNHEFRKIETRGLSARRLRWLITGFVIVCFALSLGQLVGKVSADLAGAFFPESRIHFPAASETNSAGGRDSHQRGTSASIIGTVVQWLFWAVLCVFGIRWLRQRTPRLERFLAIGGDAIKLVLLLVMIAWLGAGPGFSAAVPLEHPLGRIPEILLFAVAFFMAAAGRSRDRAPGFEQRNYLVAGYFWVSGILMMGNFLASVAGIVVTRLFPPAEGSSGMQDLLPLNLEDIWFAHRFRVCFALTILLAAFVLVLVCLYRRGHPEWRIATLVERRWKTFLIGWGMWTSSWMVMGSFLTYQWLTKPTQIQADFGTTLVAISSLEFSGVLASLFWVFLVMLVLLAHFQEHRFRVRQTGEHLIAG